MKKQQTWYNKIGFFSNPFSIKPAAFHDRLSGYEKMLREINSLIKTSNIIFLEGDYGTGKTTILKKIINMFRGKKKVIYYSLDQTEKTLDLDMLLHGRYGFIGRLFRIKPKGMILLVDEATNLNSKDINNIKDYFEKDYFKSIILAGGRIGSAIHAKELKSLVGKKVFTLGKASKEDAISMVRGRIGKLKILSDDVIEKIYNYSQNPRDMLKNTEDVLRHAVENDSMEVSADDIKAVLG